MIIVKIFVMVLQVLILSSLAVAALPFFLLGATAAFIVAVSKFGWAFTCAAGEEIIDRARKS